MQLDTEDGETFVPPAGVVASPTSDTSTAQHRESGHSEDGDQLPAVGSTTAEEE